MSLWAPAYPPPALLLRTILKAARGGTRPGRCRRCLEFVLVVRQVEGAEGSQPTAWTIGAQFLEGRWLDALGEGCEMVVVASGKALALFSFLSEMRSKAFS